MAFFKFFDNQRRERRAHALYHAVVLQARNPAFYLSLGVPDTVDGRFDLIVAHAFLVMRRLGRVGAGAEAEAKALSQAMFDMMFADMDSQLREMGVTDLAVGRKVHQMAEAFYGRVSVYDDALSAGRDALAQALARNLYRTATDDAKAHAEAVAAYLEVQEAGLSALKDGDVMAGKIAFTEPQISEAAP